MAPLCLLCLDQHTSACSIVPTVSICPFMCDLTPRFPHLHHQIQGLFSRLSSPNSLKLKDPTQHSLRHTDKGEYAHFTRRPSWIEKNHCGGKESTPPTAVVLFNPRWPPCDISVLLRMFIMRTSRLFTSSRRQQLKRENGLNVWKCLKCAVRLIYLPHNLTHIRKV